MRDPADDGFDGTRLAWARKHQGLSQHALATLVGVREKDIQRWESGQNKPRDTMIVALADTLHVSTDFLLGRVTGERDVQGDSDRADGEQLRRRARRNGAQTSHGRGRSKRRRPSGK